jgi:hypothetical protein
MEFIKDRNLFKKKNMAVGTHLQDMFYTKYNKNPVDFQQESLLKYNPLTPLDNVIINNNDQLMILNGFIGLVNGIINDNQILIKNNPLLRREKIMDNPEKSPAKKSKKSKKEEVAQDPLLLPIQAIDWKKIIWSKKFKTIELQRIVNFYFFSIDEHHVGLNLTQEYLMDHHRHLITTTLKIHIKQYLLVAINDVPVIQIQEGFNGYMNQPVTIKNLNIIGTVLSILSSMESARKNILMIKNIKPDLYTPLINYYQMEGKVTAINAIDIQEVVDNIMRIKIQMEVEKNQKKIIVEEFFDFDCPSFSAPELIVVHNKN